MAEYIDRVDFCENRCNFKLCEKLSCPIWKAPEANIFLCGGKEYIPLNRAVTIADYAVDEHPYERYSDISERRSEYNKGWNDACDYIRGVLERMEAKNE